jgi:solute:Na+ symporter, SSS family
LLLLFIIAYLVATVLIGVWAARKVKTAGDFMLAGRSLPLALSSAALFATWFGSETVFGASSEFLKGGLFAVVEDPFGAALCLVLFGIFYSRKLYKMNLLTLGDFFRVRFDRKTELVASLFLAPPYVGYIAAQLVAMGLILNAVTGLDVWIGVIASSCVVTLYTYVGGMWAVSITDFVQSILIVVGLVILAAILANKAGGVGTVLSSSPLGTFRFLPDGDGKSIVLYGQFLAWGPFRRKTSSNGRCPPTQQTRPCIPVFSERCSTLSFLCFRFSLAFAHDIYTATNGETIRRGLFPTWSFSTLLFPFKFCSLVRCYRRS